MFESSEQVQLARAHTVAAEHGADVVDERARVRWLATTRTVTNEDPRIG